MTTNKKHALVVSDNMAQLRVLNESLIAYTILTAPDGSTAIQLASETQPEIILLDAMTPDLDVYELCQQFKKIPSTEQTDVIFILPNESIEEKLKGYEAGGNGYLTSPIKETELQKKIQLALRKTTQRIEIETNGKTAMQTAMTAMNSMGEMGVLLGFMTNSFTIKNTQELGDLVIDAVKRYDLESCIQIFSLGTAIYASSSESVTDIEKEKLLKSRVFGRITEKDQQLIINFDDTTLLIKNMPEDNEKRGRLRDHLSSLMEATNSRLQALTMHQEVSIVVKDASQSLTEIEKIHRQQKEITTKITDELLQELARSFNGMNLTDTQEDELLDFVHVSVDCLLENIKSSNRADKMLVDITGRLKRYS